MNNRLQVENLTIKHKESQKNLVTNLNFSVGQGESLIILGQSGSGKSMTCNAIMGLLNKKHFQISGKILFEEQDMLYMNIKERCKIYGGPLAMIPQNPMTALDPSMRIGKQMKETLRIHAQNSKSNLEEKIKHTLHEFGLSDVERVYHSYPYTLSGGMLQRITIAMAIMVEASVIIADEPTTALDVIHRNSTIKLLIGLRERGTAIVLVTHDFSVAKQMGGQLLVMKDSKVIERGNVETILETPANSYTQALLEAYQLSCPHKATQKGEPIC